MTVSVVQTKGVDHAYSGSLTSAATAGNTLFLFVAGDNNSSATSSAPLYNGASVPGAVKVWERVGTGPGIMYAAVWMLPNLPTSGTSVAITCNATSINGSLTAVEVFGLGPSPSVQGTPVVSDGITAASLGPTAVLAGVPAIVFAFGAAFFGWAPASTGLSPWSSFFTTSANGCVSSQVPGTAGGTFSWAGTLNTSGDGWAAGIALIIAATIPAPFTQPGSAVTGSRAARKGTTAGFPGTPVSSPSPSSSLFTQPHRAVPGCPAARKGTAAGSAGAPRRPVPSPFRQPPPARGCPAARTGRAAGITGGAPRLPWPSPFTEPRSPVAGRPLARKGAMTGSPGAPYVRIAITPSPFRQPGTAIRGARAAVRGRHQGSPGAPVTVLRPEFILVSLGGARLPWSLGAARTPWSLGGAQLPWSLGAARNR